MILWSTFVNCILPIDGFIKVGRVFVKAFLELLQMHFLLCSIEGQQVKMSEDHRIASYTERLRMQAAGEPLKDGETRLCGNLEFYISSRAYNYVYHSYLANLDARSGLNLARMLGDKFLKQQEARFSSEPYISQVVCMNSESRDFAIMAR